MSTSDSPYIIDPPIITPQPDLVFTKMTIQVMGINLGVSASLLAILYNGDTMVCTKTYNMEGDDYNNWGSDDQYVYTWVANKLQSS